jgi:hypothetical protein
MAEDVTKKSGVSKDPIEISKKPVEVPKEEPLMIPIGKHVAATLQNLFQQIGALKAEETAAKSRFDVAVTTNQAHVAAIIEDAGFKLEQFPSYGVFEDKGKFYLRAGKPQQQGSQ